MPSVLPRFAAYMILGGLLGWGSLRMSAHSLERYRALSHDALLAALSEAMKGGYDTLVFGAAITALLVTGCFFAGDVVSALVDRHFRRTPSVRGREAIFARFLVAFLLSAATWSWIIEADQVDLAHLRSLSHQALLAVLTERNTTPPGISLLLALLLGAGLLVIDEIAIALARIFASLFRRAPAG
jgi:hypothetical protein